MAHKIRKVEYFYTNTKDQPGSAYNILTQLAGLGIDQVAFVAVPTGPSNAQLTIFPDDSKKFIAEAKMAGWTLDGPHPAILVQGDDELGALEEIHNKLFLANVNVYASMGVTGGKGGFGYIIYVRPEGLEGALKALDL
ncbi:MAG: hypothetical protein HKN68_21110 [Saprospiraceae bacterium]|nr:hypothetical protein [Saprospiraceae bacterium]